MSLSMSHATLTREVIRIAMMTDTVTVIVTHAYSNTRFVIVSVAVHDSGSDSNSDINSSSATTKYI